MFDIFYNHHFMTVVALANMYHNYYDKQFGSSSLFEAVCFVTVNVTSLFYLLVHVFITMASCGCKNFPDSFCYICGKFVIKKHQSNITDFVKKVYFSYFENKFGDQDKQWAPHKICYVCIEDPRKLSKVRKTSIQICYSSDMEGAKKPFQ